MELARDEHEALLTLGRAIEALELAGDPVEPLEQGVELAISDVVLLHEPGFYGRLRRSARVRTTTAPGPSVVQKPCERACSGLERGDAPRRAELGECDARERLRARR